MYQYYNRSLHLPIVPATHPDTKIRLTLEDGLFLRSNSYLKVQKPVFIPMKFLRTLKVGSRRLTSKSFGQLQAHIESCGHFSIPSGYSSLSEAVLENVLDTIALDPRNYDDQDGSTLRVPLIINPPPPQSLIPAPCPRRVPISRDFREYPIAEGDAALLQALQYNGGYGYGTIHTVHESRFARSADTYSSRTLPEDQMSNKMVLPKSNRQSLDRYDQERQEERNRGVEPSAPPSWPECIVSCAFVGLGLWGLAKISR